MVGRYNAFWNRNFAVIHYAFDARQIKNIIATQLFEELMESLLRLEKEKQRKKIEVTVDRLKQDVEAIPQTVELREKIIKNTKKLESQFSQLNEQYKKLSDDVVGVRKLVGSKTFGEWKILLSEIDKINTRIDSLSCINEAYDKVLNKQNKFMEQQADVMKQQASFINWIKYATILVPIAVISVPIIEMLLRSVLNIP